MPHLQVIVSDFANGIWAADAKKPQAVNVRSKRPYQPGIGPHSESATVELVSAEMASVKPSLYGNRVALGVPYPQAPRQKCDLCLGDQPEYEWAIEVKMLRMLGDNGKVNDNILMHILSPYPRHRSALTDCEKVASSTIAKRKAILIYGYDHPKWPLDATIDAFELLAKARVTLGDRCTAGFDGLIHPIHSHGRVFAWEVLPAGGQPTSARR
jgi:hypothetical protein